MLGILLHFRKKKLRCIYSDARGVPKIEKQSRNMAAEVATTSFSLVWECEGWGECGGVSVVVMVVMAAVVVVSVVMVPVVVTVMFDGVTFCHPVVLSAVTLLQNSFK